MSTACARRKLDELRLHAPQAYAAMTDLFAEVVILWNAKTPVHKHLFSRSASDVSTSVRVIDPTELGFRPAGSPNNRYIPMTARKTWCIFSVESSVILSRGSIQSGLRTWKQSIDTLVGFTFEARSLEPYIVRSLRGPTEPLQLSGPPESASVVLPGKCKKKGKPRYNIILPVAVFFNARYLHAYTYAMDVAGLHEVRAAIEREGVGADLIFPIIVGMVGKQHPLVVDEHGGEGRSVPHTPALNAHVDAEHVFQLFEDRQKKENGFDTMIRSGVGITWKGGQPRPVGC